MHCNRALRNCAFCDDSCATARAAAAQQPAAKLREETFALRLKLFSKTLMSAFMLLASMFVAAEAYTIREVLESNSLTTCPPAGKCADLMNTWCNDKTNCPNPGTKYALFDRNKQSATAMWRCYSDSTLNADHTQYVKGDLYCTRCVLGLLYYKQTKWK